MTNIALYATFGIIALLLVVIFVFGFGVLFLGRNTEAKTAAPEPVQPETKGGFFAGQESAPASLAIGKARLDGDRTGGNFLGDELNSRNSLPNRQVEDDEFKL